MSLVHVVRPNKLTFMVLVGARTTLSARTNFQTNKNLKRKIQKKK